MSRATDNVSGPEICEEWWEARRRLDAANLKDMSIAQCADIVVTWLRPKEESK